MNTSPLPSRSGLHVLAGCLLLAAPARAAETLPSKPERHFNDYAGVTTSKTAGLLNSNLIGFQAHTTNDVYVVIQPALPSNSSVQDYCFRVTRSWRLGHKNMDNAVVLFVFVQDHKTRIEVRPGLEGALPDARCKDIVADVIAPKFKTGDYDGGLTDGIAAIFKYTEDEYDAEEIYAVENAHLLNDWNGWDTFFLIADLLIVLGLGYRGWNRFKSWRDWRRRTTLPTGRGSFTGTPPSPA